VSNIALENLMNSMKVRTDNVGYFVDNINNAIKDNAMTAGKFKGCVANFPSNILVLGCGGTGSWLAPKLIKFINDAKNKGLIANTNIVFADGDKVEEKNLIRQNFIAPDIGMNKAEVIATRYGRHTTVGVQVGFQDCFVVDDNYKIPEEHADKFVKLKSIFTTRGGVLVINLIDNGKTRKMVHRHALSVNAGANSAFRWQIIDVANNTYNGQLNYSVYGSRNPSLYMSQFYNQHPDHLGDDDDISLFSCADEDATAVEQLFNANDMAATITCNFLNHWIAEGKVSYGQVEFITGSAPAIINSVPLFKWSMWNRYSLEDSFSSDPLMSLVTKKLTGYQFTKAKSDMLSSWDFFEREDRNCANSGYKQDLDHASAA
jgi:hypothetical protein